MTLVQTELKSMKIGKPNVADMQGPAPTGYHVPSKDERVALCSILTSTFGLSGTAATMESVLKMPRAGLRDNVDDADTILQGTEAAYWSSTASSADGTYYLRFGSDGLNPQNTMHRAYGLSVRCFKDVPVTPDSSWTTLHDGSSVATGAGVFRNTTNGLISISGDGNNWTTIMDKNLGATEVFTPGPGTSFTQANCGNYYQRGNNYGFPFTGTVTTSSTQVDASDYGPGNYYSSSTFITRNGSPYDWSSVQNDNLWGGESKDTPIKRVTIRPNGVEKQIRPASIITTGIYHDTVNGLISLSSDGINWMTIADKDIGATVAGTTSASYGERYNFASIPTASTGYYIPTKSDWESLMTLWQGITSSNSDDLIMQHLLIPGAGFKTSGGTQSDIGAGLYWSFTSINSSTAWGTRFYPSNTFMDMFQHNKNNRLTLREFKITSVQPDSSRTVLYQPN